MKCRIVFIQQEASTQEAWNDNLNDAHYQKKYFYDKNTPFYTSFLLFILLYISKTHV